jgi:hypothetical protein
MREGTTSRMMAADRPYGEFYDFYSVSPEYFGFNFVYLDRYVNCRLNNGLIAIRRAVCCAVCRCKDAAPVRSTFESNSCALRSRNVPLVWNNNTGARTDSTRAFYLISVLCHVV